MFKLQKQVVTRQQRINNLELQQNNLLSDVTKIIDGLSGLSTSIEAEREAIKLEREELDAQDAALALKGKKASKLNSNFKLLLDV